MVIVAMVFSPLVDSRSLQEIARRFNGDLSEPVVSIRSERSDTGLGRRHGDITGDPAQDSPLAVRSATITPRHLADGFAGKRMPLREAGQRRDCPDRADNKGMRALSIRQPFAELILRGIKTAELRSRSTTIVGERFYIYASKGSGFSVQGAGKTGKRIVADNIVVPQELLPAWMIELAEQVKLIEPELLGGVMLPTGVIVGSAVIERITPPDPGDPTALFRWHLVDVQRAKKLRKPARHPQPSWFLPF